MSVSIADTSLLMQMTLMLMAIGGFAGVFADALGVGDGIVLVPSFFYVFTTLGYAGPQLMQICLATSLATIIITSARSVLSHHKKGAVDWQILRSWMPGIAIGALAGVSVAANLSSTLLQALFGGIGVFIGIYLGFGRATWRLGPEMPKGMTRAILSPVRGFLSVLVGIGGGSFGVSIMTLYTIPIHRAVATAAGFGMAIAVPSVIGFLFLSIAPDNRPPFTVGAVNLVAFGVVIGMTLVTAPWGVKLAHAMDDKVLKQVFAVFLTPVALNMLRKGLGW